MDKLTRTYKQVYMQMLKNICRAAIQSSGDFSDNFFRVFKMFKIHSLLYWPVSYPFLTRIAYRNKTFIIVHQSRMPPLKVLTTALSFSACRVIAPPRIWQINIWQNMKKYDKDIMQKCPGTIRECPEKNSWQSLEPCGFIIDFIIVRHLSCGDWTPCNTGLSGQRGWPATGWNCLLTLWHQKMTTTQMQCHRRPLWFSLSWASICLLN